MHRNKIFFALTLFTILPLTLRAEIRCIAHRGYSAKYLENSPSALFGAYKNSDGIEFDIRHTRDGRPIIMHNRTLDKTATSRKGKECPLNENISDLTYQQIKTSCVLQNGESIPTLREVLRFYSKKNFLLYADMKDFPTQGTIDLFEKYRKRRPDLLRIISFEKEVIKYIEGLKKIDPFFWGRISVSKIRFAVRKLDYEFKKKKLKLYMLLYKIPFLRPWLSEKNAYYYKEFKKLKSNGQMNSISNVIHPDSKSCLNIKYLIQ